MKSLLLAIAFLPALVVQAEDWPQWRGPRGDGISQEKNLATQWPAEGPKKVWTVKVGQGYSSPLVFENKIYLFTYQDGKDILTAFHPDTGAVIWSQSTPNAWNDRQYPGTRATPTIDKGKIYTYNGGGDLVCREVAGGKLLWGVNVLKETRGKNIQWGVASSPVVDAKNVYLQGGEGGATAIALDKNTGKVVWKSEANDIASYASTPLIKVGAGTQLVVFAGDKLMGMDAANGKTLWQFPWDTQYKINASTPIFADDYLFAASNYGKGGFMLKFTDGKPAKVAETKDVQSRFQGMILDRGHLYVNSEGTLKCLTWPDLKMKWSAKDVRLGSGGSIVRFGDHLVALSENGVLYLLEATPDAATKVSEMKLFTEKQIWSTPLLYKGKMYVKGGANLVCLDIGGK